MRILVVGGEGFSGWPTASYPVAKVCEVAVNRMHQGCDPGCGMSRRGPRCR